MNSIGEINRMCCYYYYSVNEFYIKCILKIWFELNRPCLIRWRQICREKRYRVDPICILSIYSKVNTKQVWDYKGVIVGRCCKFIATGWVEVIDTSLVNIKFMNWVTQSMFCKYGKREDTIGCLLAQYLCKENKILKPYIS